LVATESMITFFSAGLRSRAPTPAAAAARGGAGDGSGVASAAVDVAEAEPAVGRCGPPAHADSVNPAARAPMTFSLNVCKGRPFVG
jgi:hypothetical protein